MDIDTIMALASKSSKVMDELEHALDLADGISEAISSPESLRSHLSQSGTKERQKLAKAASDDLLKAQRASYRAGDVAEEALKVKGTKDLQARMLRGSFKELMPSVPRVKGDKVVGPVVKGQTSYRLAPDAYSSIADRVSGKRRLIRAIDSAGLGMIDSASGTSKQFRQGAMSIDALDALKGKRLNPLGRGKRLAKSILAHEFLGSPLYRAMSNRANAKRFEALAKSGAKGIKDPEVIKAIRSLDSSISPIRVVGSSTDVSRSGRSPNTVYSPRTPSSKVPGSKGAAKTITSGLKSTGKAFLKSAPIIGGIDDLGLVMQDIEEGDWRGAIAHTGDAILDTVGIGAIVNLGFNLGSEHTGFFDWAIGEGTESGKDGLGHVWGEIKGLFD